MPDFADKVIGAFNMAFERARDDAYKAYSYSVDSLKTAADKASQHLDTFSEQLDEPVPVKEERLENYIMKHKYIGLSAGVSASLYLSYQVWKMYFPFVRKAQKLPNGRRFEVVLVVGHPESSFVRRLVNDLNTRGYIVFVTVTDETQLEAIESIQDDDIKPLIIDYDSTTTAKASLSKLANFLDTPTVDGQFFNLRGVLFVPDYFRMPKIKSLDELNSAEYQRVMQDQFLNMNTLLSSGLRMFLGEANSRRPEIEKLGDVKLRGGFAKLIFVNFQKYAKNETRMLLHHLAKQQNKVFYDELYRELSPGLWTSIKRCFGVNSEPGKIDMTMLDVTYKKDTDSHLINGSSWIHRQYNRRLGSDDVHFKIFDLLNSTWLRKNYSINRG